MAAVWVVLELNSRCEGEDPELIRKAIRGSLDAEAEIFLPAAVTTIGDDQKVYWLAHGYAFVRRDKYTHSQFMRLEATRFVQTILTTGSGLATVQQSHIDKMRHQLQKEIDQGIGVGDKVLITTGPFKNIEASVIEEIPEEGVVQVFVKLRSKETIVTIPRAGLEVLERAPVSHIFSGLTSLRMWCRRARPVFAWDGAGPEHIVETFQGYEKIESQVVRGRRLYAFISFLYGTLDPKMGAMRESYDALRQLTAWVGQGRQLYAFVSFGKDARLAEIRSKLVELFWFDDIQQRIKMLRREVEAIGHKAAKRRKDGDVNVIQNVIVDGHNLAFRCLHAPGMSDLKDDKGRPTGVILGFLRGLGALKKRFPEARLYVTWDGSNDRRKALFGDYKGNRKARSKDPTEGFDQLAFLRETLPLLGVRQAFNAEEEADDVIATLVRGPLNDQHNLIFTTDRDLLQLVSDTTVMLTPRVGSRREVMYDLTHVKDVFGVGPKTLVQLRAFYGDSSDNIPGVPRVPKKVLRALVQAHGSVDGVYDSGLTGVTRGQYERLRSAEPQVRINVGLMTLQDVNVSVTDPDVDADGAAKRLRTVAIQPTPIVDALFGRKTEAPTT